MAVSPNQAIEMVQQLLAQQRPADAVALMEQVEREQPDEPLHCLNLATLLMSLGLPDQAIARLKPAEGVLGNHPGFHLTKGLSLFRLGKFEEAESELSQARRLEPTLFEAIIFEARALLELGELSAARATLGLVPDASQLGPEDANEYAIALIGLLEFEQAEKILTAALRRSPDDPHLRINLAQMCERANRLEDATILLNQVAHPDPVAQLLQARIAGRMGNFLEALRRLEVLQAEAGVQVPNELSAQIEFEKGRWLDRLGRHSEAFSAFTCGNRLDQIADRRRPPQVWEEVEQATALFVDHPELDWVASLPGPPIKPDEAPIFVVGFPRSGTTLLERMLDAHPDLQVIEEKPLLDPVVDWLMRLPGGYPASLAHLTEAQAEELRRIFWQSVASYGPRRHGARIVDKNPFNLLRIHLIGRLFPKANWLFLIRHPCDVILSCYMQRLQFTPLTRGFRTLEEISEVYEKSISLWLRQRSRLPLNCVDVRYEDLVSDPQRELGRVIGGIDARWAPDILDYRRAASARWVTTPSYDQVNRPLYRDAIGRWKNYRTWMRDVEMKLSALIEELGYA